MTTAQDIIDRAAQVGIKVNLWEKAGRCRLYARARKDMNIYLECDGNGDCIEGAALKVFCNTEQHPNWIRSQVKQQREAFMGLFHAYVVEMYKETGPYPNGYGPDINEMIDEAREFFADVEKGDS
jgi:hypothetical protein